ncbi:hypothetical protein [Pyruvatibacter sp.]
MLSLLTAAGTLVSKWLGSKIEKSHLRAEASVEIEKARNQAAISQAAKVQDAEIAWDQTMAQGSLTSWKSEFWTVVIATPLILCFVPIVSVQNAVLTGFKNLDTLPGWYIAAVGLAIGAAFGYRKFVEIIQKK